MDAQTPQTRSPGLSRIEPYLVAIGLTTAALWVLLPQIFYVLRGDPDQGYWGYNAAALALTYFETGFARRELAGTLAHFLSPDPMIAAAIFHILTTLTLAPALIFLVTRSRSTIMRRIELALAALVILWRLMSYIGSVDALVMLLGLGAALATVKERWITASVVVAIALLVHEVGVIVLVPLLAIICIERKSWPRPNTGRGGVAIAILCGALLLYLASLLLTHHIGEIARHIHSQIASRSGENQANFGDLALYATLSGTRGLQTIQCLMWSNPYYSLHIASAVLLTILFGLGLRPWNRWPSLSLILTWVIGLSLIGFDVGRWTTFALFSVLTLALLEDHVQPIGISLPMLFSAVTAFLLMSIGLNTHANFSPIPMMNFLDPPPDAARLGLYKTIDDCDPGWRASLGLDPWTP